MVQKPQGAPNCYGVHWSAIAAECKGGPDPAYVDPKTGSHVRSKCSYYTSCAAAKANNKAPQPQQLHQLHHQPPPPPPPVPGFVPVANLQPLPLPRPMPFHPGVQQRPPMQQAHQFQQPQPPMPTQMVPPWQAQQGPPQVPMVYQQPGAQMSAYLSVPEPYNPEEHWGWRLLREIFRSMFKSSAHTAASFMDHNPLRPHQPPPPPPTLPPAT